MTRHWVEANLDKHGAGFDLICEHPQACSETSEDSRTLSCCVKDFFDDMGTDLFEVADKTAIGRVEVDTLWRGSGEDAELALVPINYPAAAGSQPAGVPIDWKRIATQVVRYGGSFHGLSTRERDAVEAEVKSAEEQEWGVGWERTEDAADRGVEHA